MKLREIIPTDFTIKEIAEGNSNALARLKYAFIIGDKKNTNGRTYPSYLLKREIDRMKARIAESSVVGQVGHPYSGGTQLDKISHVVDDVSWDSSHKRGIAVSNILKTSKGGDLLILLKSNVKLGASVRGYGSVSPSGEVLSDYRLEAIDIVVGPSFGKDVEITKSNLIESGNQYLSKNLYLDDLRMRMRYQFARKAGFRGSFAEYGAMKKE